VSITRVAPKALTEAESTARVKRASVRNERQGYNLHRKHWRACPDRSVGGCGTGITNLSWVQAHPDSYREQKV